jgi:hypothetical protein
MAEQRRGFWQENALTLVFMLLFLAALVGQAVAGWHHLNEEQEAHKEAVYSFWRYVSSSEFGVDVMENWQSEFLQFASFIALSIWFRQRGSTESKSMDQPDIPPDKDSKVRSGADAQSPAWAGAGGWRTLVYSNSLLAVMVLLWLGSWAAQCVYLRQRGSAQSKPVGAPHHDETGDEPG